MPQASNEEVDWPVQITDRLQPAHERLNDIIEVEAAKLGLSPFETSSILMSVSAALVAGFLQREQDAKGIGVIAGQHFTATALHVMENRDKWMAMHRAGIGPDGRRKV